MKAVWALSRMNVAPQRRSHGGHDALAARAQLSIVSIPCLLGTICSREPQTMPIAEFFVARLASHFVTPSLSLDKRGALGALSEVGVHSQQSRMPILRKLSRLGYTLNSVHVKIDGFTRALEWG